MKERIIGKLKEIEEKNNVKIIFAADTGSRNFGYATENSDYDIRFIFIHKPEKYLSLKKRKETIETKEEGVEFVGFDIKKALSFVYKSNIQIWQWLHSTEVYISTETSEEIKKMLPDYFKMKEFLYQYAGSAGHAFKRKIVGEENPKIKYYINIFLRLATALRLMIDGKFPEKENVDLVLTVPALRRSCNKDFEEMLAKRLAGEETIPAHPGANSFIEYKIKQILEIADDTNPSPKLSAEPLDKLFAKTVTKDFVIK